MGYYMSQMDTNFYIRKECFDDVIESMKKLHGKETCGEHFSWVDDDFYKRENIYDILLSWRWEARLNNRGDIDHIEFMGEKYGDEPILFNSIASYVDDGIPYYREDCYIEMNGVRGRWRWIFIGDKCIEVYGNTIYKY